MSSAGSWGVLELMSPQQWVGPVTDMAGRRVQGIPKLVLACSGQGWGPGGSGAGAGLLVGGLGPDTAGWWSWSLCPLSSGWSWGPQGPRAGARPLVGEAGSWTLVNRAGSWDG